VAGTDGRAVRTTGGDLRKNFPEKLVFEFADTAVRLLRPGQAPESIPTPTSAVTNIRSDISAWHEGKQEKYIHSDRTNGPHALSKMSGGNVNKSIPADTLHAAAICAAVGCLYSLQFADVLPFQRISS
jgi:hypothetical protein